MNPTAHSQHGLFRSRWRIALWGIAGLLLLLPGIAMQFTREVAWGPGDFVLFGALLAFVGGSFELAVRRSAHWTYRAGAGLALASAFLLLWMNLAVGIIGEEGHPANQMFGGVVAVGILGALAARFRPRGMSFALVATAIAQVLAGVTAHLAGWGRAWMLTGLFGALWLTSACLFGMAARKAPPASPSA